MEICLICETEAFEYEYVDDGIIVTETGCECPSFEDDALGFVASFEDDPQGFIERNGYIPTGAFNGYYD